MINCDQYLPNLTNVNLVNRNEVNLRPVNGKKNTTENDGRSNRFSKSSLTSNSSPISSPNSSGSSRKSGNSFDSNDGTEAQSAYDDQKLFSDQNQPISDPKQNCLYLLGISGGKQPHVANSSLVRQRVTAAKESLASAVIATGASLPLMIGGRSRCVVNLVEGGEKNPKNTPTVPRNTALRADQRRQNVVRPQVKIAQANGIVTVDPCQQGLVQQFKSPSRLEESSLWAKASGVETQSVLDVWMKLHDKINNPTQVSSNYIAHLNGTNNLIANPLFSCGLGNDQFWPLGPALDAAHMKEQQKNELMQSRREQMQLEKGIKQQHRFLMIKIDERKRNLQIVRAVWQQKDFKRAIEKLVDIYNQGLVFADANSEIPQSHKTKSTGMILSSLNTSLVVDVISVIVLRPKLWNLDVCQLLLPIIVNDLLLQSEPNIYGHYIEMGIKSVKLILLHFSDVIVSTLNSQPDDTRLTGVDISREDRISKCQRCLNLLLEAHSVISSRKSSRPMSNKLKEMLQEVEKNFSAILAIGGSDTYLRSIVKP